MIELIKQHIQPSCGRRHSIINIDRRSGTVEALFLTVADKLTLSQTLRESCDLLHGLAHLGGIILCLQDIRTVFVEICSRILGIKPGHCREF